MPLSEFIVCDPAGEQIGVVHVPLYEKWGAGIIFARPPYAMSQDEVALKKTITTDSRGAHLIAAVNIAKGTKFYAWRQRVQITNQDNVLVDIADYDKNGDGKLDPTVRPNTWNWALDRQSETDHEWYCSKKNRAQAVYRNEVYWDSLGQKLEHARAERFMLFEDNPN